MSFLHVTQLAELSKIIYEERLQEAEQSRRLAAFTPVNSWPWFFNLSNLFKPKSAKLGQPTYPALAKGK
jgi:hypothetical protein